MGSGFPLHITLPRREGGASLHVPGFCCSLRSHIPGFFSSLFRGKKTQGHLLTHSFSFSNVVQTASHSVCCPVGVSLETSCRFLNAADAQSCRPSSTHAANRASCFFLF